MKYYLDTNVLYRLSTDTFPAIENSFTSCLSIFELLSGINDFDSFKRRKGILQAIQNSNLRIIWDLPKTRIERSFGLKIDDSDVQATKALFEGVVAAKSYTEAKELVVVAEGKCYKLETLENYDRWFCDETVALINSQDTKLKEGDVAEDPLFESFIVESFISSIGEDYVRPSDKYFEVLKYFESNSVINVYIRFLAIYILYRMPRGINAGKNDGFDIGHLSYLNHNDVFVSSDSIYKILIEKCDAIFHCDVDDYLSIEASNS
ncbi:hypothetical protein HRJ45_00970 [Vibrio coralliilyticus]|uniref:hypothetical protein n=1 Tax=Vibrio coralliilyticus TaxID=190893 RepID=UPI00155F62D7|nr:hypothetical protein [Vibrio coralliilyticus]NRF23629.1 hypothetical protein [Vibrio coralliilyticus]NRF77660.1 hypothetical protein [Vibrio coralliilyticus]